MSDSVEGQSGVVLGSEEMELLPATHRHHPCVSRIGDWVVVKDDQSGQSLMYSPKEFEVVLVAIPRILASRGQARAHFNDAHVRFGMERIFDTVTLFRQNGKGMESVEMDVAALEVLRHCRCLLP